MRYNLLELLILGFLNNISDIGLEIMLISARVSVFYLLVENIVKLQPCIMDFFSIVIVI